jgi:hypothetical protein
MTPADLLAHLARLGATLTRTGIDSLDLDGPSEVMTDDLVDAVRAVKPDLLALLELSVSHPVIDGDDGRRVWIWAMGELLCWPRLPLGGAESVASGQSAWGRFIAHPQNGAMVDRAVGALNAVGHLPVDEVEQAAVAWWRARLTEGRG